MARAAFEEAVRAVQPRDLVRAEVAAILAHQGSRRWRRIVVLGAGKAVEPMMDGVWAALAEAAADPGLRGPVVGMVVAPVLQASSAVLWRAPEHAVGGGAPWAGAVGLVRGGHPTPDRKGARAARSMLALMASAGRDDLVLGLVSGGASALMALPTADLSLEDLVTTTGLLLRSGAPIAEVNAVRAHLSAVAGGKLGGAGRPGRALVLVVSDVVGDDLGVIGSGPFFGNDRTFSDCLSILRERGVEDAAPPSVVRHLEAGARGEVAEPPRPSDPVLARVEHRVVARNLDACRAAAARVERSGYRCLLLSHRLEGEARDVGVFHAGIALGALRDGVPAAPPFALVTGGEATVTVRGAGRGGRNQETCLAAVPLLAGCPISLLSAGTDGIDGPTAAAGAVVDGGTADRARRAGVDVARALADNDSNRALESTGDLLVTGPTGTNVADVRVVLVGEAGGPGDRG